MTTSVKIMTHLWPVEVTRVNPETGEPLVGPEVVPPHSNIHFYLSSTHGLVLKELPAPEKPLQPQPTVQQPEAVQ